VEKRNSEFQRISQSLFSKNTTPQSADVAVWLGVLNYRLQGISSVPARQMIEENRQSVSNFWGEGTKLFLFVNSVAVPHICYVLF
jgi:hypothetical protein